MGEGWALMDKNKDTDEMTHNLYKALRPSCLATTVCLTAVLSTLSLAPLYAGTTSSILNAAQNQKPIVLAQAQPKKKAEETSKKSKPAAKKPAAAKKKASPWAVQCGQDKKSGKKFCRMQQNLRYKKTGQRLLSVIIQPQTIEPKLAILLSLPHGLYLPAGTAFKIDDGTTNKMLIETCDVEGCYASGGLNEKLIDAMKKGEKMLVGFQASNKKPITIPISLTGFTAAFNKITGTK